MVRPKKHLGQHFLTDKNIAKKITQCLGSDYTSVCELGPGTGILTEFLLSNRFVINLTLIEIDKESVVYLREHFHDERLQILEADFLKTDLKTFVKPPFVLIGNFPYNISSQIFFKVIENRNLIPEVVGMVQKEVAERIVASNGNKTYGILSVLLQAWFDIEYCFTVNETVFFPPPKVKSAVIKLRRNATKNPDCDEQLFMKVVKTGFGQRRKTLRNALKPLIGAIQEDHDLLNKRAEQLTVSDFAALTRFVETVLEKNF